MPAVPLFQKGRRLGFNVWRQTFLTPGVKTPCTNTSCNFIFIFRSTVLMKNISVTSHFQQCAYGESIFLYTVSHRSQKMAIQVVSKW